MYWKLGPFLTELLSFIYNLEPEKFGCEHKETTALLFWLYTSRIVVICYYVEKCGSFLKTTQANSPHAQGTEM